MTGFTTSTNFPTTAGAFDTTSNGGGDAFVTKLDPTGAALVYSTYLGGSGNDQGHGIAVDAAGNAYVTGVTESTNFPTTPGAFDTSFTAAQRRLRHQARPDRRLPGLLDLPGRHGSDLGLGIAVDTAGNAYVTGRHELNELPDDSGRLRYQFQRHRGRLRHQAGPDRRLPCLLDLPGRQRQ